MPSQQKSKLVSKRFNNQDQPYAAFLLQLSDTLRALINPLQMQRAAMKLVAQQLYVIRASYYEVDANQDDFIQTASFETALIPEPRENY